MFERSDLPFAGIVGPPGLPGPPARQIVKGQSGKPLKCDKDCVMVRCWSSCGEERIYERSKCVSSCNYRKNASSTFHAVCCRVRKTYY